MENNTLISIIIPVFNGEPYIADAIRSVLEQTYKFIEVIVIDDGSTDGSAKVIKSFSEPVQYFYQDNSGTAAARNFGINKAKGAFFTFVDQDDLWVENKLSLQFNEFQTDPEIDIVFGHVKQFFSPEVTQTFRESIYCPDSSMPGYLPSAMMVKKETLFRVGQFDSQWQIGEWANWYVRASELKLNIKMLPEIVTLRRIHESNKGVLQRKSVKEYVHILKASLDRRRKIEK